MRASFRGVKCASTLRTGIKSAMYESSCSYAGALELKRSALKEEPWPTAEWPPYRLHQSTFEQLKQSVEKAKAALQDRSSLLGTATAFGDFYGGQLTQDAASTIGFGRTTRTDETMLGTIEKNKSLGSEKLSSSLGKGYSPPTLSETLRATKCSANMSSKDYYNEWLKHKIQIEKALQEDLRIQQYAVDYIGVKPQTTAVETVARVYCKYVEMYNKLCELYDQLYHPQRTQQIKKVIDTMSCRIMELKAILEDVEVFEYTYSDNALQQMLMVPQDVEILTPFFYTDEIRSKELQYVVDAILGGERLGDPTPTPSEILRQEEARLEEERIQQEEREKEMMKRLAMGEEIEESISEVSLSSAEKAELAKIKEYEEHLFNIQRMERSRKVIREKIKKFNKDANVYLELAGLKTPLPRESLVNKAVHSIVTAYKYFMNLKREHVRANKVKEILGMVKPSYTPPSAKIQLEKVKQLRREFKGKYVINWLEAHIKQKNKFFKLRKDQIMEDISDEIRFWFEDWYDKCRVFDEYPYPEEGGSILVVKGETFTIPEFLEWREEEMKRLKKQAANPVTKEELKARRLAEKEEKKRLAQEAKEKEKKRLEDFRKKRLNPDADPGVVFNIGTTVDPLREAWVGYENEWKNIDMPDPALEVFKGHIMELITENVFQEIHLELRPIVDEMMRIELQMLRQALKREYESIGQPISITQKRKKPKKPRKEKPDPIPPKRYFQRLVDEGVVHKYPHITLDDYWGDRNFAAADTRGVLWTPSFPPACLGDVKELVRNRCILAIGCDCPGIQRTQLIVGPVSSGKKSLIYAVATETNSVLIDLSPKNLLKKLPGPKGLKVLFKYVNKVVKYMQPVVIMVEDADKVFYKKVPKEEIYLDPTRLSGAFFKEIVKPNISQKVMIIGTASQPWMAKANAMKKAFPSCILIPRTDYASISFILTDMLMKYHAVNREFDVHSCAQALRGYDIGSIKKAVAKLLDGKRIAQLYHKPLTPLELLNVVLVDEGAVYTDEEDYAMFWEWYLKYTPWGEKLDYYRLMLDTQLEFKIKAEKKKKKG